MRVLVIFCAAFAAGVALSQYLLSAQWALILCGVFAAAALVMGLCGCANKRGDWAKRAFLCALGLCFAFGYNTLYAHFIKAPNDALLGTQDTVEVELLGYAEETSHGAKVTVKILNRGLPGRAIYYGDADLMDLEPGAHVTAEALFNSATDPTGKGLHLRASRPRVSIFCSISAATRLMTTQTRARSSICRSASQGRSVRPLSAATASAMAHFCGRCCWATRNISTRRTRATYPRSAFPT